MDRLGRANRQVCWGTIYTPCQLINLTCCSSCRKLPCIRCGGFTCLGHGGVRGKSNPPLYTNSQMTRKSKLYMDQHESFFRLPEVTGPPRNPIVLCQALTWWISPFPLDTFYVFRNMQKNYATNSLSPVCLKPIIRWCIMAYSPSQSGNSLAQAENRARYEDRKQ